MRRWPCSVHRTYSSSKFPNSNGKVLPKVILRYVQKLSPPSSTSCNLPFKGTPFPRNTKAAEVSTQVSFKNRKFLKANLLDRSVTLAAKTFTASNTPALDQRSKEPCTRLRASCPCKQQAASEMMFTPSHVPSSAFPGHGHSHLHAPPEQQGGYSNATTTAPQHCTRDRDSPAEQLQPASTVTPAAPRNMPRHGALTQLS